MKFDLRFFSKVLIFHLPEDNSFKFSFVYYAKGLELKKKKKVKVQEKYQKTDSQKNQGLFQMTTGPSDISS
jgi:hypothetical protein